MITKTELWCILVSVAEISSVCGVECDRFTNKMTANKNEVHQRIRLKLTEALSPKDGVHFDIVNFCPAYGF